jgi:hypothetical protein
MLRKMADNGRRPKANGKNRMKHNSQLMRIAILAAFFLPSAAIPLVAQNMTPEQAEGLRKDADVARKAFHDFAQNVGNPEVRKDAANTADSALDRITDQLDKYIEQSKNAAADIFDEGRKYPPRSKVRLESFDVPLNATVVHVPVTLDKASVNTVIAHVRVSNGQGGKATPDTSKAVIFRPGDPLKQTLPFNVAGMTEGNYVNAVQSSVPDGGVSEGAPIRITAKAGAVNEPIRDGFRAPLAFTPWGEQCYSVTGQTIQFDDKGGPNSLSTALPHGRTQLGNSETGYYGTLDMGGFERTPEGLVLATRRLDKPVRTGSPVVELPFLAANLSGHRTPETQFKYGSVEWVVKMPNRRGAWPALWLLPTRGWPPEIDVYEGFGYNASWKFPSCLSTNLHGGAKGTPTFTCAADRATMEAYGLPPTLDSEFHAFAVTVDKEWITIIVDTVETIRYANPFKGQTWFPLTNVGIKAQVDAPYDEGSGAMTLRSLKIWRAE